VWPAALIGFWLASGTAGPTLAAALGGRWPTFPVLALLWTAVAMTSAVLLIQWRVRPARVLGSNPAYWALLALAALSVLWSVDPLWTARNAAVLAGTFLVGVVFAVYFPGRHGLVLIQACLGALVLLAAAVALVLPDLGVQDDSAWRGLFAQKNWLGNAAALWVVILSALAAFGARRNQALGYTLLGVAGGWVLWQSASVSALLGCLSGVGIVVALRLTQGGWLKPWQVPVLGLLLISVLLYEYPRVVAVLGRDPLLTGRVDMWRTLWPIMLDRPWLGYGYDAYLRAEGVPERLGRWREFFLAGADTHNGFVRLQLDVGIVGVVLAVALFAQLGVRVAGWVRAREITVERGVAASLWWMILLHQLTEPSLFMPTGLPVLLLVYSALITTAGLTPQARVRHG
jgi:exopolysaccharide production protein ExoQ